VAAQELQKSPSYPGSQLHLPFPFLVPAPFANKQANKWWCDGDDDDDDNNDDDSLFIYLFTS
jgi:hypothetical protein